MVEITHQKLRIRTAFSSLLFCKTQWQLRDINLISFEVDPKQKNLSVGFGDPNSNYVLRRVPISKLSVVTHDQRKYERFHTFDTVDREWLASIIQIAVDLAHKEATTPIQAYG